MTDAGAHSEVAAHSGDAAQFDDVIHSPIRLRICGMLSRADQVEFQAIRDILDITEAHLSKNLKVLSDAGYIRTTKAASLSRNDARRLTWIAFTSQGRQAFTRHFRALQQIAGDGPAIG